MRYHRDRHTRGQAGIEHATSQDQNQDYRSRVRQTSLKRIPNKYLEKRDIANVLEDPLDQGFASAKPFDVEAW